MAEFMPEHSLAASTKDAGGESSSAASVDGTLAVATEAPTIFKGLLRDTLPTSIKGQRGTYTGIDSSNKETLFLRLGTIFLTESASFEYVALSTIIVNCVTMAMDYRVAPGAPPNPHADFLATADLVFLVLYTAEMALKMNAFGVAHFGPTSWWCNGWAIFEGLIVFISWTPFLPVPTLPKTLLSVLRAMRSLRVLRALFIVPGMKELINSTLSAVPALASVTTLWFLVIYVMSIAGVQLFMGVLHERCALPGYSPDEPVASPNELVEKYQFYRDGAPIFCNGQPDVCPVGTSCVYFEANPNDDTVSFDSVLDSLFPLIHTLIGDSWSANMYMLMDAGVGYAWVYFCSLAALGGFLLVQLFLAVISDSFVEAETKRKEAEAAADETLAAKAAAQKAAKRAEKAAALAAAAATEPTLSEKVLAQLNNISQLVVVYNVIIMCMKVHRESGEWHLLQEQMAAVATWFFIGEMAIKVAILGWSKYWADVWNKLDGSLVISSIIEIIMQAFFADLIASIGGFTPMLRMLRMLRIVRALKAAKSMPIMRKMIGSFTVAMPQVVNLVIFMFCMMFIFTIIGMNLFGGSGMSDYGRLHFDNFPSAMVSMIGVLLGKYVVIYQAGFDAGQGAKIVIFCYTATLILYLTIVNLFVAILVQAFSSDDDEEQEIKASVEEEAKKAKPAATRRASHDETGWLLPRLARMLVGSTVGGDEEEDFHPPPLPKGRQATCAESVGATSFKAVFDQVMLILIIVSSIMIAIDVPRLPHDSTEKIVLDQLTDVFTVVFTIELLVKFIAWGIRGYFASAWNVLDFFIVLVSLVGVLASQYPELEILLTLRILRVLRPLRLLARNPGTRLVMTVLFSSFPIVGAIVAVVLFVQTVFAIIGMHMFMGTMASCSDASILSRDACVGSYFDEDGDEYAREWRNPWVGSFDSFGAAMMTLFQAVTADTFPDLITYAMDTVGVDVPPVPTAWAFSGLYFIAWILIGNFVSVNLFVGAIVDNFISLRSESDGSALLTTEQKQWVKMVTHTRHVRAMRHPAEPTLPADAWGAPFAGVLWLRKRAYEMVLGPTFQNVMLGAVVVNINMLAFDYHGLEDNTVAYGLWHLLAEAFFYCYWFEFLVKLFGLGVGGYFSAGSRCFEAVMLMLSVFERTTSGTAIEINPVVLRLLRISKVLKLLKLLTRAEDLAALLQTLAASGPALVNIVIILSVVVFMYAVLGMHLFTFVMRNEGINDHANFETLGSSFLLLFQVLTGDSWSPVMHGAMIDADLGCDPDASPTNCGSWVAAPYFVSYLLIGNFCFLNLFVAVVIENFSASKDLGSVQAARREQELEPLVTQAHIDEFVALWSAFDKNGDNIIIFERLQYIVANLSRPLGVASKPFDGEEEMDLFKIVSPELATLEEARRLVADLPLKDKADLVDTSPLKFSSALDALVDHAFVSKIRVVPAEITLAAKKSKHTNVVETGARAEAAAAGAPSVEPGAIGLPPPVPPPAPEREPATQTKLQAPGALDALTAAAQQPLPPSNRSVPPSSRSHSQPPSNRSQLPAAIQETGTAAPSEVASQPASRRPSARVSAPSATATVAAAPAAALLSGIVDGPTKDGYQRLP